jgi:hypothetical protein
VPASWRTRAAGQEHQSPPHVQDRVARRSAAAACPTERSSAEPSDLTRPRCGRARRCARRDPVSWRSWAPSTLAETSVAVAACSQLGMAASRTVVRLAPGTGPACRLQHSAAPRPVNPRTAQTARAASPACRAPALERCVEQRTAQVDDPRQQPSLLIDSPGRPAGRPPTPCRTHLPAPPAPQARSGDDRSGFEVVPDSASRCNTTRRQQPVEAESADRRTPSRAGPPSMSMGRMDAFLDALEQHRLQARADVVVESSAAGHSRASPTPGACSCSPGAVGALQSALHPRDDGLPLQASGHGDLRSRVGARGRALLRLSPVQSSGRAGVRLTAIARRPRSGRRRAAARGPELADLRPRAIGPPHGVQGLRQAAVVSPAPGRSGSPYGARLSQRTQRPPGRRPRPGHRAGV